MLYIKLLSGKTRSYSNLITIFEGIVHQFGLLIFFVSQRNKHFLKRTISIKQLWNEIIEKIGCSKSVRASTVIYIIYIAPLFSNLLFLNLKIEKDANNMFNKVINKNSISWYIIHSFHLADYDSIRGEYMHCYRPFIDN